MKLKIPILIVLKINIFRCVIFMYFILMAAGGYGLGRGRLLQARDELACANVCQDLPDDDYQPVCMMFSRYKRGYQFFINLCHARRAICNNNLILELVHPARCLLTQQFYSAIE